MLASPPWCHLQPEDVTAIRSHLQITVQDVLAGAPDSVYHLQKEKVQKQVPALITRPAHEIGKLVVAFIKSMLFAGGYTLVVRRTICFLTTHYKFSSVNGLVGAFLGGATLCFEPAGRQSEIALYCVNKTL